MSAHPIPSPSHPDDASHQAVLQELIDRGMDLARLIHERAKAEIPAQPADTAPPAQPQDPTIAFDRIARTVRRTIALARHIAQNPAHTHRQSPQHPPLPLEAAKTRILRDVEDAIFRRSLHTKPENPTSRHQSDAAALAADLAAELAAELDERLLDPALADDLRTRPLQDIIDEIARDLGVHNTGKAYIWKRRTPADVQHLRARAGHPPPPPPHRLQHPPNPPTAARQQKAG